MRSVLFSRQIFITFLNKPNRSTTVLWEAEPEVLNILNLRLQRENGHDNYNHSFQCRPSVPFRYKINASDITRHPRATFIGLYDSTDEFRTRRPSSGTTAVGRTDRQAEDGRQNCFVSDLFHLMRKTRTRRK